MWYCHGCWTKRLGLPRLGRWHDQPWPAASLLELNMTTTMSPPTRATGSSARWCRDSHSRRSAGCGGWSATRFCCHAYGVRSLTMIDVTPDGDELWEWFLARTRGLGVPDAECISADLHRFASGPTAPTYDVDRSVILYHVPDPIAFLAALRRIVRKHLVNPPRRSLERGSRTRRGCWRCRLRIAFRTGPAASGLSCGHTGTRMSETGHQA